MMQEKLIVYSYCNVDVYEWCFSFHS